MARVLNRIWIRSGLYTTLAIAGTILVMAATVYAIESYEHIQFLRSLPTEIKRQMDYLETHNMLGSPQAQEIYAAYQTGNPWLLGNWTVLAGLLVSLPFGLIAGFWVSRHVSGPLSAIATAARRIAEADFSVRAIATRRGGMGYVLDDFNAMANSLESLERDRKVTAAAISHELRTPLAVLGASLHALSDGILPATPPTFDRLNAQVMHLSRLIDDVHTLSVADAGRLTLNRSYFDLAELADNVLNQFQQRLNDADISPTLIRPAIPPMVFADRDRMHQVLGNLVENVVRYARVGKKIQISINVVNERIVLMVQDWGQGLPPTVKQHLFERFYRPDASRTRATGGTGLGLAIVKTLMTAQDGDVTIDSEPDTQTGCTATITLPASRFAKKNKYN